VNRATSDPSNDKPASKSTTSPYIEPLTPDFSPVISRQSALTWRQIILDSDDLTEMSFNQSSQNLPGQGSAKRD